MSQKLQRQSGQVALIVLLIMGVTLVIAISLAQRTSEDIELTTKQAETTKVFSAAQSGAEQTLTQVLTALRSGSFVATGTSTLPDPLNDSVVEVTVAESNTFIQPLDEGETYQVSLASIPINGWVTIEWGDSSAPCSSDASLLIARYNTSGSSTTVTYSGYYPIGMGCSSLGDGFAVAPIGGSDGRRSGYRYQKVSGDEFLRIIPIYNSTDLYVSGASDQQYTIVANAKNDLGDNQETRVVQVTTSDLQPPPFLDYAVYSGTTISKP